LAVGDPVAEGRGALSGARLYPDRLSNATVLCSQEEDEAAGLLAAFVARQLGAGEVDEARSVR
jgi:hypothetical protein